ncbi:MAG: hypothetical protein IJ514_07390 [Clostridia bacterium]|nr:hypothetical protein [Clostridia bacterium]
MDAKITKQRLARILSYDWIKIVALAVAAVFLWTLIFTMTATRITAAQQFTVFNYYSNDSLGDGFSASYSNAFSRDKIFSYEVIETNTNDLRISGEDMAASMLETRVAVEEGDVMLIPDIPDTASAYTDDNGNTQYAYSYMQGFFNRYYLYLYELDPEAENGYFKQMEAFLNGFYVNGYEQADSLDEGKVEAAFKARIKANKDKRFKKEAQIAQGVQDELARIKKYRDALVEFYGYLTDGTVTLTTLTLTDADGNILREGKYGLNLCPNEGKTGELKKVFSYTTKESYEENGETKERTISTAKNMHAMFFKFSGVEKSFEYETLLYVNYIVRNAIAATQA